VQHVAAVEVRGNDLVIAMTTLEKIEGAHGEIELPLTAVTNVRVVDDAWPELRGIRAPGTGVPGKIAVGTRRGKFGKDFAVVHGKGPALVLELTGASFQRIVLTVDEPAALAATIALAQNR
jgi:hypothetical protein